MEGEKNTHIYVYTRIKPTTNARHEWFSPDVFDYEIGECCMCCSGVMVTSAARFTQVF
jgi:hypothetical protein